MYCYELWQWMPIYGEPFGAQSIGPILARLYCIDDRYLHVNDAPWFCHEVFELREHSMRRRADLNLPRCRINTSTNPVTSGYCATVIATKRTHNDIRWHAHLDFQHFIFRILIQISRFAIQNLTLKQSRVAHAPTVM